jgi:hypothetical protein
MRIRYFYQTLSLDLHTLGPCDPSSTLPKITKQTHLPFMHVKEVLGYTRQVPLSPTPFTRHNKTGTHSFGFTRDLDSLTCSIPSTYFLLSYCRKSIWILAPALTHCSAALFRNVAHAFAETSIKL